MFLYAVLAISNLKRDTPSNRYFKMRLEDRNLPQGLQDAYATRHPY